MPYVLRKTRGKNCFRVTNQRTKKVFAKCATRVNAEKQLRLLRAIQNNKKFVANSRRRSLRR
jgi:hypothetical protein